MKRRGLFNKISVKKNQNIPNETEKIVNFLFTHYKSMGTIGCHNSSIGAGLAQMTSQNGGQDGRHGSVLAQLRVTTSYDPVTRSVSPRKVS